MSLKNEEIDNDTRWLILRAKIEEENIKTAFRLFKENDVEPILIKGWAAAREYPEGCFRHSSDIDLCVAPIDFDKSLGIISSEPGVRLNIDLHKGLRHLDTVAWEHLFENTEIVKIDDVGIRILRAEDHLRVLCVHWLTDGGADRKKLLDMYYLLMNKGDEFDWNYCFAALDDNRRDWIIKTLAVVDKFYPLDSLNLPFKAQMKPVPDWFQKALEREWESDTRLQDIHSFYDNRKELWRQFKKRLRPNPIQATVFMDGNFNTNRRFYYQIGSFLKRLKPSIGKAFSALKYRLRRSIIND